MEELDLPAFVRDYRLETRFLDGGVVEHSCEDPEAPPGSPLQVENWESGKLLGKGGQGRVLFQRCLTDGRTHSCRAVKKMPLRGHRRARRYGRELESIFRFSHQRVGTKCNI